MDRYTSMMISNVAQEYLEAAQIVRASNPVTFRPTYFLVCRSIELSLKAFLRGSGYGDDQLLKIRHNLQTCLDRAVAAGVQKYIRLSEDESADIAAINYDYKSKDFEYTKSGYKESRPHIDALLKLARRIWQSLREFCEEQREYHFDKATAVT